MLKIHQIKCDLNQELNLSLIAAKLGCSPADIHSYSVLRESLDARRDSCVFTYTVKAQVRNEQRYLGSRDVTLDDTVDYAAPQLDHLPPQRPVIAGFGPAGMFAGLLLAEAGLKPVILERGASAQQRQKDVQAFLATGQLDPQSNVQFGEGGAGTFSDGKLTTRIKDLRIQKVLAELIEAGAPAAIAWQSHPHLGTDQLVGIVTAIRQKIIRLGGEVRFHEQLQGLTAADGALQAVQTSQGSLPASALLLCIGHSAGDTCRQLLAQGICMEAKEFAIGARAEHPQELIDRNQYGRFYGHPRLQPAEYHLAHTAANGRGVYTFCMCPGGFVIPSMSEPNTIVVNGMSYSSRSGSSANSAILVQVKKKDFPDDSPLAGFAFQHRLEAAAYQMSGSYRAPAQNITDFIQRRSSDSLVRESTYAFGTCRENLWQLLPAEVSEAMAEGLQSFDRMIPGFCRQGILVGLESRSSSPVRILRGADGQSISLRGLYPCGEGAGYAGGIVSSAVDGIRQAENLIHNLNGESYQKH